MFGDSLRIMKTKTLPFFGLVKMDASRLVGEELETFGRKATARQKILLRLFEGGIRICGIPVPVGAVCGNCMQTCKKAILLSLKCKQTA
jgi:hypothetical protein